MFEIIGNTQYNNNKELLSITQVLYRLKFCFVLLYCERYHKNAVKNILRTEKINIENANRKTVNKHKVLTSRNSYFKVFSVIDRISNLYRENLTKGVLFSNFLMRGISRFAIKSEMFTLRFLNEKYFLKLCLKNIIDEQFF